MAVNFAVAFFAPFSSALDSAFDPRTPSVYAAFASIFMHDPDTILHLLGNLVFLAAVGPLAEASLGHAKFLVVYLVSGLAGVGAHWGVAVATGVGSPLIGASAAIAGCVGYCCVRYVSRKVPLAPWLKLSVGSVAVIWIVLQAVGAFVRFGDGGGPSYVAHIGGFVAGLGLAFVFRAQNVAKAETGLAHIDEMGKRSAAALLASANAHLESFPADMEAMENRADALHQMGEYDQEAQTLVGMLRAGHDPNVTIDRLASIGGLSVFTPRERMQLTERLDEQRRRMVLDSVAGEPDDEPERPHALLELIERTEGQERAGYLEELKRKYPLHGVTELARSKGVLD